MNKMNLGLCKGRHEMPVNNYIFENTINPLDVDGLEATAVKVLNKFNLKELNLYATSLTAAHYEIGRASCRERV